MKKWHLLSGGIDEVVEARESLEAFDSLRERPVHDFGLIVVARPEGRGEDSQIPIRTSMLFFRWGRDADAKFCIEQAIRHGMPDTTELDRQAGKGGR